MLILLLGESKGVMYMKLGVWGVTFRSKQSLHWRVTLMGLKWEETRQSVSDRIHYVIRDLWMDQLLQSVGMPLIDSANADVTCHGSHTSLSLPIWSVCNAAASLARFVLYHVADSEPFRCSVSADNTSARRQRLWTPGVYFIWGLMWDFHWDCSHRRKKKMLFKPWQFTCILITGDILYMRNEPRSHAVYYV